MGDNCETTDALERMEAHEAQRSRYYGEISNQRANAYQNLGSQLGAPQAFLRSKGQEAQEALRHVLDGTNRGLSISALERAVATVKAHLEAEA